MAESKRESIGKIKIDLDVSDAITGLKAVQREAKAATKALAELREEQVEISVEEAVRTLEKALENSNVDVSNLKEGLRKWFETISEVDADESNLR